MPFQTYAQLQAAVLDWAEGEDLSGVVTDLILLAEARLNRELVATERLERTTYTAVAAGSQELALPADCWEIEHLRINAVGQLPLEPLLHRQFWDRAAAYESGVPDSYTVYNGTIYLAPILADETDFALDYVASIPPLASNALGTWLTANYPDAMLHASLVEAALYVQDDQAAARELTLLKEVLLSISGAAQRLRTRPGGRVRAG